jgi:indole-3-glycerol phosphate synthase
MRKDFIVDPYQVWEARAAGADGVLAIVRMLDDETLLATVEAARTAGMFSLVEVFDEEDARRSNVVADSNDVLIGVNSRDLMTLEVRPEVHRALLSSLPPGSRRIAESGLSEADDVRSAADLGYHGVLVGSALMRGKSSTAQLRSMVSAGATSP